MTSSFCKYCIRDKNKTKPTKSTHFKRNSPLQLWRRVKNRKPCLYVPEYEKEIKRTRNTMLETTWETGDINLSQKILTLYKQGRSVVPIPISIRLGQSNEETCICNIWNICQLFKCMLIKFCFRHHQTGFGIKRCALAYSCWFCLRLWNYCNTALLAEPSESCWAY